MKYVKVGRYRLLFLLLAGLAGSSCKGHDDMSRASAAGVNAPEFPKYDRSRWLNAEPLTMKGLRGKIVLVDFWEYTCVNCLRTLPYVEEWYRRYAPYGLVVVGVHTPEFAFGRDRAHVARAVKDLGVTYPVVLDNDYEVWRLYANSYWPRKYIVDADGKVVYDHIGEGGYAETEEFLQKLIREQNPAAKLPPVMAPARPEDKPGAACYPRTPELYAGYARGRYGNRGAIREEEAANYRDEGRHAEGALYLSGRWRLGAEEATYEGAGDGTGGYMLLPFTATEVNAVMQAPGGKEVRVYVTKDGEPLARGEAGADVSYDEAGSYIAVSFGRMYRIYNSADYGSAEVALKSAGAGVAVFAFTFGSCAVK